MKVLHTHTPTHTSDDSYRYHRSRVRSDSYSIFSVQYNTVQYQMFLKKNQNAPDFLSIPQSGEKNVKTFRWDNRLQIQKLFLIHTLSVLSAQLKKLRRHNKSAIDLSNVNPVCGHKEVPRSTGHIVETTRYSDQQESKSRQKVMRLYKQW